MGRRYAMCAQLTALATAPCWPGLGRESRALVPRQEAVADRHGSAVVEYKKDRPLGAPESIL